MKTLSYLVLLPLIALMTISCGKQNFTTDGFLELKQDTVTFDTVFTTIGSTTKFFKIHNPHDKYLNVSDISLAGGDESEFRININGAPVLSGQNYEIAPKDSMYIFVEVTVDPNQMNNPFVIKDSIVFMTNDNLQKVVLLAYGQNANYYNGEILGRRIDDSTWVDTSITWTADKPYLIYNSVLVAPNTKLTIEEGCQLHFHGGSRMYVAGTLVSKGTPENMVTFKHDRLESDFDEEAGQWEGIHFLRGSYKNYIYYTVIENSIVGVRVDSLPVQVAGGVEFNTPSGIHDTFGIEPNVLIENSIIRNITSSGIVGITAVIEGRNLLVYNCGQHNVQMEFGGIYDFDFCTFVNMQTNTSVGHKSPIVRMGNYNLANNAYQVAGVLDVNFTNSIIYGHLDDEIELDTIPLDGAEVKYRFQNTLIKRNEQVLDSNMLIQVIEDQDPLFADYTVNDYSLQDSSAAINAADRTITYDLYSRGVEVDLYGNLRIVNYDADLGAIEKQ